MCAVNPLTSFRLFLLYHRSLVYARGNFLFHLFRRDQIVQGDVHAPIPDTQGEDTALEFLHIGGLGQAEHIIVLVCVHPICGAIPKFQRNFTPVPRG